MYNLIKELKARETKLKEELKKIENAYHQTLGKIAELRETAKTVENQLEQKGKKENIIKK